MSTLLVFVKYPAPGKVKTRLAEAVGNERAADLYREWIGVILLKLQPLRGQIRVVGYFDGADREAFAPWDGLADDWWTQPVGDLGDRLTAGFARGHADGGAVAAIGTDCLDLDASLMFQAFKGLGEVDAVFGPALDGGYYLVGTARLLPDFFREIPWSSATTLAAHLAQCRTNGWSTRLLPPLRDIDTLDDLRQHARNEQAAGEPNGAMMDLSGQGG